MLGRWAVHGTRLSRACTGRAFHCTPPTRDRIAVGISGGVDSAVAALLLQRAGHDVQGLFMRNWDEGEETGNRNCSVEADAAAAARVCRHLGVPLAEVDFVSEYWTRVFEGFLAQAGRGLTPNPDLACNRHIKFDLLAERAAALGCGALATGHYARLEPGDPPRLLRARDAARDQTYFLASYLAPLPGHYRDVDSGADLGPAANLLALTLGQRASVGGGPQRAYVAGKDARYGQEPLPCTLRALGMGGFRTSALCTLLEEDELIGPGFLVAHFDEPARAITPQQAFVMYDGERCLGSALIAKPGPSLAEEAGGGWPGWRTPGSSGRLRGPVILHARR
ncbi:tRNA-specific 2-thiouridylase MnmA [Auxenochlorella protothecoides]|uniref:tRNA-specific 2-thiouridylase MnmA n=1 Tax=Auxenochlorella protothecoides TaxID=3075 RepID=A0A087SM82_AUXPR|nr:tRNA-specific 2-thiouridylase MnmA [Auxenochlorella protothecoides]KFM26836.1 tRNA-specific 2-thiouridylase MnmA [Auxenochlorella protothecoides]